LGLLLRGEFVGAGTKELPLEFGDLGLRRQELLLLLQEFLPGLEQFLSALPERLRGSLRIPMKPDTYSDSCRTAFR